MKYKLIVADGSPTVHKIIELVFANSDFDVKFFMDSDELINALPDIHADGVLLNLSLPGKDGYKLIERII